MKYILGIDVGGTKIAAGLVDKSYKVTNFKLLATSQTDLLGQIGTLINSYRNFEAIGVGMPGVVSANGLIRKLPNIPDFKPTNLKSLLERRYKVPVSVVNDSRAFTLAEAVAGTGKKYKTVAGIILGTGIGSGLVQNKKIKPGKLPLDGEIGRIRIRKGVTLEKIMQQSNREFKDVAHAEEVIQSILAMIINSADPEVIVFGGGRTSYKALDSVLKRSLKSFERPVKTIVKISKLKHAGIIGAALPLLLKD